MGKMTAIEYENELITKKLDKRNKYRNFEYTDSMKEALKRIATLIKNNKDKGKMHETRASIAHAIVYRDDLLGTTFGLYTSDKEFLRLHRAMEGAIRTIWFWNRYKLDGLDEYQRKKLVEKIHWDLIHYKIRSRK